jgi:1-pyrroline-5-carboxylate dehydrogenase
MSEEKKITYVSLLADESINDEFEKALDFIETKLGQHHPMFVGDKAIFSNEEFDVRSPIDSDIVIGYFQKGTREDINSAISEARNSFYEWSSLDWKERVRIMRNAADYLDQQKFHLAALITLEAGKNRYEALAEVGEGIDFLRYYSDIYEEHLGFTLQLSSYAPGEKCQSVLRPHGVWTVVSPFNFPIALAAGMASAALLTGNTIVLKPTSTAPFSGLKLYQTFVRSGVPSGAVNVITGPGLAFGEEIVKNPDVAGIAFTGSRAVGMWLYRNFSAKQAYPKPIVLELGSKNPTIVTPHADIEKAVEGVVKAAFGFGGEKCSATSRVYVHTKIFEKFTEAIRMKVDEIVVGDPRKKDVFFGPLINSGAFATYKDAIDATEKEGGRIIAGGKVLEKGPFSRGYYVTPTVVTGIPQDHALMKDELFVPFLIVDTFESLEEALGKANDTEYGLTAGIFSEDPGEIDYFFRHIQFGVTYANRKGGSTTGAWPGAQPFGGWKGSGSTGRGVGGPYYMLSFLREQAQTRI